MSEKFNSIKYRLFFWFVLVGIIPLLLAIGAVYFDRLENQKKNTRENLKAVLELKAENINDWLNERKGDLNVIAGDFEVKNISKIIKNKIKDEDHRNNIREIVIGLFNRYITFYDAYSELFILHPDTGKVILSTNVNNVNINKANDHYYVEAKRTNSIYIKDIYYSNTTNKFSMVFSIPIRDNDDTLAGILCLRCNLENSLFKLLLRRTSLGKTGESLLINKNGYAISELKWFKDAPLKLKINAVPAKLAIEGKTGTIEIEDYRKKRVLAAYTNIKQMGWGLVCKEDIDEINYPLNTMLFNLVILFIITFIILIIVSVILSRSIADPVTHIVDVTKQITQGNTDARTVIQGDNEISVLGTAINEMAYTIDSKIKNQLNSIKLSSEITGLSNLHDFGKLVITAIEENTEAIAGALYCIDEIEENIFRPVVSIGLDQSALQSFDVQKFEGEIGKTVLSKKITFLDNIDDKTTFLFKTVTGSFVPKEIISIPIKVDHTVFAVLSIISASEFSSKSREFITQICPNLDSALEGIHSFIKTRRLSEELEVLNSELNEKAIEVKQQSDEISTRNIELEQKHDELATSNKLKSEFLSNMSHELRTPLNSVIALSNVLLEKNTDTRDPEETKYIEIIERNGKKLLILINDILDLSKIEAGKFEVSLSTFSIIDGLKRNIEIISALAEQKNIEIRTDFQEQIPSLQSDIHKFDHIFLNILSNAVKFTDSGYILISAKNEYDQIIVSIEDTGIGIDSNDIKHIFNEFQQIDGTSSRKFEGTGLGLAIAKKTAELIGGKISVESTPGKGTIFTVSFPCQWNGNAEVINAGFTAEEYNHYASKPDRKLQKNNSAD